MPSLFQFCPPPPSCIPCPLGRNHRCRQMQTTGWKMLVDSILVCLRLVSEQWGSFLNHLSCWWNSWTPTPDTDQGGRRPCRTTGKLRPKWDSAELKLTVILQTVSRKEKQKKPNKLINKVPVCCCFTLQMLGGFLPKEVHWMKITPHKLLSFSTDLNKQALQLFKTMARNNSDAPEQMAPSSLFK